MTTIVPTTEEDPALAIVRFVSDLTWADAGAEVAEQEVARLCREAEECLVVGRWFELASLIVTSADLVFSKVGEKDLECIYTVICNLVSKSERPEEILEMAKLISGKVAQQPTDKPSLRLKILFNLYNLLDDGYARYYVYMKALHLAASGKVTEHVILSFKKVDEFLKEWNIGVEDQRELFLTISNILRESKSNGKDSFNFLSKYLATFSSENADGLSQAKDVAVQAIVEFIKAPDMFQCDLLDMPAVAQLEKDAKHSSIYQLLKIFLTERLDVYLEFQAANSDLLNNYGLVHDDCVAKMKLTSLTDLAHESHQIPYALIKETLRINDDEVESWFFKAVTAKLLKCKMDQINQLVIVSYCTERVFGPQQWANLRIRLATWRGNILTRVNFSRMVIRIAYPLGAYCRRATYDNSSGLCVPYNYQLASGRNLSCGGANVWGLIQNTNEIFCPEGSYCPTTIDQRSCSSGHYCRAGSTEQTRCSKLISCKENTATQDIHYYGAMLIVALVALLLIIYNCSDQIITIHERRRAKSREKAARFVRESEQARGRWKSAIGASMKRVAS